MNTEQIKSEIQKSIEELPEGVLLELLKYLRQLNSANSDEIRLSTHLSKILKEDSNLLRRLAE
jgi:hypothetical protein